MGLADSCHRLYCGGGGMGSTCSSLAWWIAGWFGDVPHTDLIARAYARLKGDNSAVLAGYMYAPFITASLMTLCIYDTNYLQT